MVGNFSSTEQMKNIRLSLIKLKSFIQIKINYTACKMMIRSVSKVSS